MSHNLYLLHFCDDDPAQVQRVISMRGADTEAERAHFFDVMCCKVSRACVQRFIGI